MSRLSTHFSLVHSISLASHVSTLNSLIHSISLASHVSTLDSLPHSLVSSSLSSSPVSDIIITPLFIHSCLLLDLLLAGLHVAQPCRYCFYSLAQNGFFAPQGGGHVGTGELSRANFHVYRGKNVGIQPPKLSKFRILASNLYLRGDSFAIFLRNSQRLYACIGSC